MWCQNNTRLILYLGGKSKFLQILTLDTYSLMDLSLRLHKGMTIVCRSYVIGYKSINPISKCGVKKPPDFYLICGQMGRPCPEVIFVIFSRCFQLIICQFFSSSCYILSSIFEIIACFFSDLI